MAGFRYSIVRRLDELERSLAALRVPAPEPPAADDTADVLLPWLTDAELAAFQAAGDDVAEQLIGLAGWRKALGIDMTDVAAAERQQSVYVPVRGRHGGRIMHRAIPHPVADDAWLDADTGETIPAEYLSSHSIRKNIPLQDQSRQGTHRNSYPVEAAGAPREFCYKNFGEG